MATRNKLETEISVNTKDFNKGLDDAAEGVEGFGARIGKITAALTTAGIAFKVLVDWFKATEQGADTMNIALSASRQLINDLMTRQGLNVKQAIQLAKEENKIREGNRQDLVKEAMLQREIRKYRRESVDIEKTLEQRIESAKKALEKTKELERYRKKDLFEELRIVEEKLKINSTNTKLLDRQAELIAEIAGLDNTESLGDIARLNSLLKEQGKTTEDTTKTIADMVEEIKAAAIESKKLAEAWRIVKREIAGEPISKADISNLKIPTLGGMPSLPGLQGTTNQGADAAKVQRNQVMLLTDALYQQQEAVNILSASFSSLFLSTGNGFQAMIDTFIDGLKRLMAELLARAAVMALFNMIPGAGLGGLLKGAATSMFGNMNAMNGIQGLSGQAVNVKVDGTIRGKDLAIALRRNI